MKAGSLSFWKWKLARQGSGEERSGGARVAPLQFVELTAKEGLRPALVWAGFEVVLSSGRTVRVADGFDEAELARLVGVLEERCP